MLKHTHLRCIPMLRSILLLFLFYLTTSIVAGQTIWTGDVNSNWKEAGNWSLGVPNSSLDAVVPQFPTGNNFPEISGFLYVDYNITCFGELSNSAFLLLGGTLTISAVGQFDNHSFIISWGTIDNRGPFQNSGLISSPGTIMNSGNLDNSGQIYNNGFFNNNGTVNNYQHLNNQGNGSVINSVVFNNYGSIYNQGDLNLNNGSQFDNAGGVIYSIGNFGSNGFINNTGTMTLAGFFLNNIAGKINNIATITFQDVASNSGIIDNFGYIASEKNFTNDFAGVINNFGTVENRSCAILNQFSSVPLTGSVVNHGIIYAIGSAVNVVWGNGVVFTTLGVTPAPSFNCQDIHRTIDDDDDELNISPYEIASQISVGYCYVSKVSVIPNTFTCDDVGPNIVTVEVTDGLGFISTCSAVVSIECEDEGPNFVINEKENQQVESKVQPNPDLNLQLSRESHFKVFPNPASNIFTVDLTGFENQNLVLEVVNFNGQKIYTQSIQKNSEPIIQVDCNNFHAGVYTVVIINESGDLNTQRLMINL